MSLRNSLLAISLVVLGLAMIAVRTLVLPCFIKKEDVIETRAESISIPVQSLLKVKSNQVIEILHLDDLLKLSRQLNVPIFEYRGANKTILFVHTTDFFISYSPLAN